MSQQETDSIHAHTVAPFTIDEATVRAIRQVNLIASVPVIGLVSLVAIGAVVAGVRRG